MRATVSYRSIIGIGIVKILAMFTYCNASEVKSHNNDNIIGSYKYLYKCVS